MTNEQILKKVIEKAVKNGYKGHLITKLESGGFVTHCSNAELILSHSFAKAFWGEKEVERLDYVDLDSPIEDRVMVKIKIWQYYLQQLTLAKDRLKYLEKFL